MSPREFTAWWYPERLPLPTKSGVSLTTWSTAVDDDGRTAEQRYQQSNDSPDTSIPEPGKDYFVNEALLTSTECPWGATNVLVYPDEPELHRFRHEWVLRRLPRPVVPSPVHTLLPHKKHTQEERSKLCSVYLLSLIHI